MRHITKKLKVGNAMKRITQVCDDASAGEVIAPKRQRHANADPAGILDINFDCISYVAEFMDYDDLVSMARTCRHLRVGVGPALERIRVIATGLLKQGFAPYTNYQLRDYYPLDDFRCGRCNTTRAGLWACKSKELYRKHCARYVLSEFLEKKVTYNSGGIRVAMGEDECDTDVTWWYQWFEFYVKGLLFKSPNFGAVCDYCADPAIEPFGTKVYEESIPGFKWKLVDKDFWHYTFECADKSTDRFVQMIQMHIAKIQ